MSQVQTDRTINAPLAKVWEVLADFGGIHRFHPGVERSPITNDKTTGLGSQRTCHFYDGGSADEEIVRFEEGKTMAVAVLAGPAPVDKMVATFTVDAISTRETKVTIAMDYRPKYGPLGSMMNALVMRRKLKELLGKVLDGLAEHTTTGALVGKHGATSTAQVAI